MFANTKIIHPKHSGRVRPHEHTSYMTLFLLLVMVGGLLVSFSITKLANAAPPGPEASSIGLTGVMPSGPPTQAATITSPKDGQHFGISPITVTGTCPKDTLVEVYKNNIFAGSTPCETDGTYTLQIDLLYGQNTLTVHVYDALNQAGPQSSPITVFYDAAPLQSASLSILNFSGTQLLLNSDSVYRGTFPKQALNVPISIIGGTAPFAINVQWGDSDNKIIPRSDNTTFNATHTYDKAGTYKVTFQATDGQQQVAFLAVAAVINGQPEVLKAINSSKNAIVNKLLVLWPLFAIALTMVISFWVGEKREKKVLTKHGLLGQPPVGGTPHLSI